MSAKVAAAKLHAAKRTSAARKAVTAKRSGIARDPRRVPHSTNPPRVATPSGRL